MKHRIEKNSHTCYNLHQTCYPEETKPSSAKGANLQRRAPVADDNIANERKKMLSKLQNTIRIPDTSKCILSIFAAFTLASCIAWGDPPSKSELIVESVTPTQYVIKTNDGSGSGTDDKDNVLWNICEAAISNRASVDIDDVWVHLTVSKDSETIGVNNFKIDGGLKKGVNLLQISVPDTNAALAPLETCIFTMKLFDNGDYAGDPLLVYTNPGWERTRHWEFYLSQTVHTDIGYTDYQEQMRVQFGRFLELAKEYVKVSKGTVPMDLKSQDKHAKSMFEYKHAAPGASRDISFKYAIESSFIMGKSYMERYNADQILEVLEMIDAGDMTMGAGQFNVCTEVFSTEAAARFAYYTNRFMVDKLGPDVKNTLQRMFDNPSFSKGYVDMAVQAGIKYGMHAMNHTYSPYHKKRQFDVFYMEGAERDEKGNAVNRMLIFNWTTYANNMGFFEDHSGENPGTAAGAEARLNALIAHLVARRGDRNDRTDYPVENVYLNYENYPSTKNSQPTFPYDKIPLTLIPVGDNKQPYASEIEVGEDLNAYWKSKGYVYPKIKSAFPEEFFQDMEKEYGHIIPVESGTVENWWNEGWGTTAYESGINKLAEGIIPIAETVSAISSALTGKAYPYKDLNEAYERALTYDEHTWGYHTFSTTPESNMYDHQFEWKRSNAFGAKTLGEKVMADSLSALASNVKTDVAADKSIFVYNHLNWKRNDVVTVDARDFPQTFEIKDGDASLPYNLKDGKITFVAKGVPALGYKTFSVTPTVPPPFEAKTTVTGNVVGNEWYRVSFAEDGTISGIYDKKNNKELINPSAKTLDGHNPKFNQYIYYDNSTYAVSPATPATANGVFKVEACAIGATIVLDTSCFSTEGIRQRVILYDDIPRIDIINEVVKTSLGEISNNRKEHAYYTFPFKAGEDYEIRYDLPTGNTAEGDQINGTSCWWYSANKWVCVKDKENEFNITLAIPNTVLLMFDGRHSNNVWDFNQWPFDRKSKQPTIYSYILNNLWMTNFQADQPGYVDFRYSITSGFDAASGGYNGYGKSARFGWEITTPLQATVLARGRQFGWDSERGLIGVDKSNVHLSTMKTAEANSDGVILRFHEIEGKAAGTVTVKLPFDATGVIATDVIENNITDTTLVFRGLSDTFCFSMPAFGTKTFRVTCGSALPAPVGHVNVVTSDGTSGIEGTKLDWTRVDGALYYEVFRSTESGFTPGTGNFLTVAEKPEYFDTQVTRNVSKTYYYKVRAVGAGAKGIAGTQSRAAPSPGEAIRDNTPPDKPILGAQIRNGSRVDLYWTPVRDNIGVSHYEIYRDSTKIFDSGTTYFAHGYSPSPSYDFAGRDFLCSYRDRSVIPQTGYTYYVRAVDTSGNFIDSDIINVTTDVGETNFPCTSQCKTDRFGQ